MLLADIARARGYTHPSFSTPQNSAVALPNSTHPVDYPFHLILTSATIPASLASYLTINHPKLTRLASPNLHRLPSTLKTEHHAWTSGNKNSDVEKRIKHVWADDARSRVKSKILIFCNKSSKVEDLGLYLTERGIPNVALTSTAEARSRGSNRHLVGFLKATEEMSRDRQVWPIDSSAPASRSDPYVLITTSLLSRGLDFSPQIKHVFIVDEPRNMIDFLHRAGRSGRAGNEGKVVVFGKMKGRGSENSREVKRKIGALAH
jgi:ATP-dependent RNA helicase MRH4, mitochondrial